MHETSIVHSIIGSLEQEFSAEELERMTVIRLKVGKLSNIEPQLLRNAFSAYHMGDPRFEQVALEIESVVVKIRCETCGHITQVEHYRFLCEQCGRPSKNLIQGEELLIHQVEFAEPNAEVLAS